MTVKSLISVIVVLTWPVFIPASCRSGDDTPPANALTPANFECHISMEGVGGRLPQFADQGLFGRQRRPVRWTEYAGVTPEFIYGYWCIRDQVYFWIYDRENTIQYIGHIEKGRVQLKTKRPLKHDFDDPQSIPLFGMTSFYFGIIFDPKLDFEQKQTMCQMLTEAIDDDPGSAQFIHDCFGEITMGKLEDDLTLIDERKVQILPDSLLEAVRKIPEIPTVPEVKLPWWLKLIPTDL